MTHDKSIFNYIFIRLCLVSALLLFTNSAIAVVDAEKAAAIARDKSPIELDFRVVTARYEQRGERTFTFAEAEVLRVVRSNRLIEVGQIVQISYGVIYRAEDTKEIGSIGGRSVGLAPAIPLRRLKVEDELTGWFRFGEKDALIPSAGQYSFESKVIAVPAPPVSLSIDRESFRIEGNKITSVDGKTQIVLPSGAVGLGHQDINGDMVKPALDATVHTFTVKPGILGFHISSYGVQQEGSGGVAAGGDMFIAFDQDTSKPIGKPLLFKDSKGRGRYQGCLYAHNDHFFLSDIDNNGSVDIGVVREQVFCDSFHDETEDIEKLKRWKSFGDLEWFTLDETSEWRAVPDISNRCPRGSMVSAPWPGLAKGPVAFTEEMQAIASPEIIDTPKCAMKTISSGKFRSLLDAETN